MKLNSGNLDSSRQASWLNGCHFVQLEIDDGDELTEEFLYDEVHPKQHTHKQAFAKPRGPAGKRGHKRLIKGPGETIQES